MKDKNTYVCADWKDPEELIKGFKRAIKKLGGHMYNIPSFNGSDTYGFIVSNKKLNKKEIRRLDAQ